MDDSTRSLVLFSGTDDELNAAAVLAPGVSAMGRSVNGFLRGACSHSMDEFGLSMDDLDPLVERPGRRRAVLRRCRRPVTFICEGAIA
jgi:peroxiredoxin family protein